MKNNKVSKKQAQRSWNVVARYLNDNPNLSFSISPWTTGERERRYTINTVNKDGYEDLLIADTEWNK